MAFTDIGMSPCPVMKMMGIRTPASANSRCKARPLTPGRVTSKTRQLGPSSGLLRRNSSAVPKDTHRNLADFSNPWMDARTPASSSTTNTVGRFVDVVHDEIHQDLLQLHAVGHDLGKICRKVRGDQYVESRGLAAQKNSHL